MPSDLKTPHEDVASAKSALNKTPTRRHVGSVVLQLIAMLGIGLLVYPQAADWVSALGHRSEISNYMARSDTTTDTERQQLLDAAYSYNDEIDPGPLTDPYLSEAEDAALGSERYQRYEEMLRLSGTEAIGTLNYPEVDIALPMYHGTTDEVVSKGVGHLYGTSLPVGGPSTRSVLTAHSGLPQARLFTDLHDAEVGDTFWVSVLGEDHYYQVREIETVLPNQTESFQVVEGEDWITLFTCTPIGVNSHRLLVHAERIDDPPLDESLTVTGAANLGFPWWALIFIAGSAVIAWILFAPPRRSQRLRQASKSTASA
jgi:sortase A